MVEILQNVSNELYQHTNYTTHRTYRFYERRDECLEICTNSADAMLANGDVILIFTGDVILSGQYIIIYDSVLDDRASNEKFSRESQMDAGIGANVEDFNITCVVVSEVRFQ